MKNVSAGMVQTFIWIDPKIGRGIKNQVCLQTSFSCVCLHSLLLNQKFAPFQSGLRLPQFRQGWPIQPRPGLAVVVGLLPRSLRTARPCGQPPCRCRSRGDEAQIKKVIRDSSRRRLRLCWFNAPPHPGPLPQLPLAEREKRAPRLWKYERRDWPDGLPRKRKWAKVISSSGGED